MLWRLQRLDEALAAAEQALARDADDAFAHHTLGLVREGRGEFDAALEAQLAAARCDPGCGLFWATAARVTARTGRDNDAERLFRQGLAAEMDSALVCRHYARFLRDRGRLSTARRYLRRAVDLDHDDTKARRDLAALDGEA
jgi:tetratricopeptide (TPR) repeat protein